MSGKHRTTCRTVLALLLACSQLAAAGEARLTCDAPTHNTDGSELTDLAGFRFYRGPTPANLAPVGEVATCAYVVTGLDAGTHYFAVTALNTGGTESALSGIGSKTIAAAPAVLRVTDPRAYRMRLAINRFEMLVLGTVPVGTECDPALQVNGYHVIPREAVTLASRFDVKPTVIYAQCSAD